MDTGAGLLVVGLVTVPDPATLIGAAPEVGAGPVLVTAAAGTAGSMVKDWWDGYEVACDVRQ